MSCIGAVRQQTAECPVAEHELKLSSFFREPTKQFCVLQKEAFQLYNHRWKSNNIKHWKQTTNKRKATQQGIGRQIGYQQSNNQTKRQPYMSKGTSNKQKRKNWREKIGWASAAPLPQYHYVFFSSKVHSKPWKKKTLIDIHTGCCTCLTFLLGTLEKLDWASAASLFTSRMQTSVSVGPHTFHGKHISVPNLSRKNKESMLCNHSRWSNY